MNARISQPPPAATADRARTERAFRSITVLVAVYLAISVATMVAIVLLRNHTADVNAAVWTRGTIVVASALLTLSFTRRAARGVRRAHLRLRIISIVMPVAIVVIIALPGTFPVWMKIEQAVCGVVLIAIAALANSCHLRSALAARE